MSADQDIKKVIKELHKLETKLQRKVGRKACKKAFLLTLERAKQEAPVSTGALRDSVKIKSARGKRGRISFVVTTDLGYGFIRNYGAYDREPDPWMTRAYEGTSTAVQNAVGRYLWEELTK